MHTNAHESGWGADFSPLQFRSTIGICALATLLMLVFFADSGHCQGIVLNAGDSWSYHFSALDYASTQAGSVDFIHAQFSFSAFDLTPDSPLHTQSLSVQLFEGQSGDGLLYSHDWITVGSISFGLLSPVWLDLEGTVTFSSISGTYLINNFAFEVYIPNFTTTATYDTFRSTVVPVPEPSVVALVGMFAFLLPLFWNRNPRLSSVVKPF